VEEAEVAAALQHEEPRLQTSGELGQEEEMELLEHLWG
jgi:hypothetical protein